MQTVLTATMKPQRSAKLYRLKFNRPGLRSEVPPLCPWPAPPTGRFARREDRRAKALYGCATIFARVGSGKSYGLKSLDRTRGLTHTNIQLYNSRLCDHRSSLAVSLITEKKANEKHSCAHQQITPGFGCRAYYSAGCRYGIAC